MYGKRLGTPADNSVSSAVDSGASPLAISSRGQSSRHKPSMKHHHHRFINRSWGSRGPWHHTETLSTCPPPHQSSGPGQRVAWRNTDQPSEVRGNKSGVLACLRWSIVSFRRARRCHSLLCIAASALFHLRSIRQVFQAAHTLFSVSCECPNRYL